MADEPQKQRHFIIDTRGDHSKPENVDADLIIEIEPLEDGNYNLIYFCRGREWINKLIVAQGKEPGEHVPVIMLNLTRSEMIKEHVQHIRELKPKTVAVRAKGAESTAMLHPGVVQSVIEGKLDESKLELR